ncbi:MAG: transposase [Candidatus Paceibacterota bacterium]|jgi:putative transposase
MERVPIELESFHHVYNRGTEKRDIFLSNADRKLFLKYLYLLNDREVESPSRLIKSQGEEAEKDIDHKPLVAVMAYCLMPNHFHLLLHEIYEGGISKFMQRLGTAYTMYFNEKYGRSGALFQGVFKSKLITDEEYLLKIIDYIHLNPCEMKNFLPRESVLQTYQYSSAKAYDNKFVKNKILNPEVLKDYTKIPNNYFKWLIEQGDFSEVATMLIGEKEKKPKYPYSG